jgi:CRP/FNR family transcriptional regulator, anaerobic regulatory protein
MDNVKVNILRYVSMSEQEMALFCSKLVPKKLKRNAFLYREGQVCQSVAFIDKGSLRYFYVKKDGSETTGQFFFENSWYTDYESFLTEKPTQQYIQVLEQSELFLLPKTALYELYHTIPGFERFGRIMAENAYLGSRKKNEGLSILSPEERYLKLIEERPKVLERIPLKYIATYLGIQPESLSRIRKRLYDHKNP